MQVRASPGPAVASMCTVEGLPSSVIAGHPFQFSLQTLDECKNNTTSTNSVTCEVDSPADGIVPLEVQELGNGAHFLYEAAILWQLKAFEGSNNPEDKKRLGT